MYIFKKYEFTSEEIFDNLFIKYQDNTSSTFVRLGMLRNDKFSVDVLWYGTPDNEWEEYEIYDVEGNGSHTFLGHNFS
jgi:hypothetical protein